MAVYQEEQIEVKTVQNILNTFLRWRNMNGPIRSHQSHHPSSWGGCLRKVQYQRYAESGHIKAEPESLEARIIRIFDTGHSMHDRWARYWEDLGVLRGVWKCTNPSCGKFYGKDKKLGIFKPDKCECDHDVFTYCEITVKDEELNFYGHVDQILDFSNFEGGKAFKKGNSVRVLFKDEDIPKNPILVLSFL